MCIRDRSKSVNNSVSERSNSGHTCLRPKRILFTRRYDIVSFGCFDILAAEAEALADLRCERPFDFDGKDMLSRTFKNKINLSLSTSTVIRGRPEIRQMYEQVLKGKPLPRL